MIEITLNLDVEKGEIPLVLIIDGDAMWLDCNNVFAKLNQDNKDKLRAVAMNLIDVIATELNSLIVPDFLPEDL